MKKIKLLIIIDELELGGTQRQLFYLCAGLDKKQYEVFLCYLTNEEDMLEEFRPHCKKIFKILKKPGLDFSLLFKLRRLMIDESIDIVHTCLFTADFWGQLAAILAKVKRITSKRNERGYGFIKDKIMAVIDRFAHQITANSSAGRHFFCTAEMLPQTQIMVVPNGFDLERLKNTAPVDLNKEFNIPEGSLIAGTVSRFVPQKNLSLFLELAAEMRKLQPNFHFILVGDGPERKQLERKTVELGIQKQTHFTGFKKNARQYIKAFDLYISTSLFEGFSNSILEAMAMGKIVWCTPVGNALELIQHEENGFLFTSKKFQKENIMIESLLSFFSSNRRDIEQNAQLTAQNYSIEKMINCYSLIYHELIN